MDLSSAELQPFVTVDDVEEISKLCVCFTETFGSTGRKFKAAFLDRHTCFSIGLALVKIFNEYIGVEYLQQRLILIFLIYKSANLDVDFGNSDDDLPPVDAILHHPFLSFFIALMEKKKSDPGAKSAKGCLPKILKVGLREQYMTGCILTGRVGEISKRTPVEMMTSSCPKNEKFNISVHKNMLKLREERYPSRAALTIPAILKVPDETKSSEAGNLSPSLFTELLTNTESNEVLPPPFHRVCPPLMPPLDGEFQFIYPFMMEPMWIEEENSEKTSLASFDTLNTSPNFTVSSSYGTSDMDKSQHLENSLSQSLSMAKEIKEIRSMSVDGDRKAVTLDTKECAGLSLAAPKDSLSTLERTYVSCPSVPDAEDHKCASTNEFAPTDSLARSGRVVSRKQPLERSEAIKLIKKSLCCIIVRTEAQKLAEAIMKDPSLADTVDIPLKEYQRYIEDNPTVAAAVIVERVKKNVEELPSIFDLLMQMKISVQAMEVVNRLCTTM